MKATRSGSLSSEALALLVAPLLVAPLLALWGCPGSPTAEERPQPAAPKPALSRPAPSARSHRVEPEPSAEPTSSLLTAFPSPAGEPPYRRVVSKRFQLSIPLPNRAGWEMRRERSAFLLMDHAATRSQLLVSLWSEDARMTPALCEERGRLLRQLPKREGVLQSRDLEVPGGFETHVDVGFAATNEGAPLDGWLLAFGARGRRCFAFVFTTEASGAEASRIVGDRLAIMQTLALEGIELRSALDVEPVRSH